MENETIGARVRKFFKFAGIDQLIHEESVGSARTLEILRGIDKSSTFGDSVAMYGWHTREGGYINIKSNLEGLYVDLIHNLERLMGPPIFYLGPIGVHELQGTYRQLLKENVLTHKIFLDTNIIDVILARTIGHVDNANLKAILARLPPEQVLYPAKYNIRWQTKYET